MREIPGRTLAEAIAGTYGLGVLRLRGMCRFAAHPAPLRMTVVVMVSGGTLAEAVAGTCGLGVLRLRGM